MSLGETAPAVAAFVTVQAALSSLVDNYVALAECLSSMNRVASLLLALDQIERDESWVAEKAAEPIGYRSNQSSPG